MVDIPDSDQGTAITTAATTSTEKRALGGGGGASSKPSSVDTDGGSILWAQNPPQNRNGVIGAKARVGPSNYFSRMDSSVMEGGVEPFTVDSAQRQEQQPQKPKEPENDPSGDSTVAKLLLLTQIGIIFGFLLFVSYDEDADTNSTRSKAIDKQGAGANEPNALPSYYPSKTMKIA